MADVGLPQIIADGMVLQRDAPIRIWGWASPSEAIRIKFLGSTYATRADQQGRWARALDPASAGGPYAMQITGANRIELQEILVGDVWLASGQSNMEMTVGGYPGVNDAPSELANADYPRLRLFKVKRAASMTPKDDVASDGWRAANSASVARFSAVAYFFGRERVDRRAVESWAGRPWNTHTAA